MADVYAIFGTLLAVGIAFPGMLMAFWLLFPTVTKRTQRRVSEQPVRSVGVGLMTALVVSIPIAILLALPFGPVKFLGAVFTLLTLTFAGLGAAGVAGKMAVVLQDRASESMSAAGAYLRGAISLELAAAFPILGWFIVLPTVLIMSLGASTLAVLGSRKAIEADPTEMAGSELVHEPQSA